MAGFFYLVLDLMVFSMYVTDAQVTKKKAERFSLKAIVVLALFILTCIAFALLAKLVVVNQRNDFDMKVFSWAKTITTERVTAIMKIITFFGSSYFIFPAYCVLIVFYLFRRDWRKSLNIAAIGTIGDVLLYSAKYIFHRHRPSDPMIAGIVDFSFPSGHSFASFTFFGLVIYIIVFSKLNVSAKWILCLLLFLSACAIAFSRVYLHVHYASDVIGGFLLSSVWLLLSVWILHLLDARPKPTA